MSSGDLERGRAEWLAFVARYGGDPSFAEKTWDSYRVSEKNRASIAMLKGIEFRDPFGAYIYGPAGTGKTHAMKARFCEFVNWKVEVFLQGVTTASRAQWLTTSSYLEAMRSDDWKARGVLRERAQEATTLFLDDLGTSTRTDWAVDQLLQLLDYRSERRLQTFITSNLTLEELGGHYGNRLASRVTALCVPVALEGDDHRASQMGTALGELLARVSSERRMPLPKKNQPRTESGKNGRKSDAASSEHSPPQGEELPGDQRRGDQAGPHQPDRGRQQPGEDEHPPRDRGRG